MLLEKLVMDLQIKDSTIIEFLDLIGNNNTFSTNLFSKSEFSKEDIQRILDKLLEMGIITVKYSYQCVKAESVMNIAENLDSICKFCSKEVNHLNHYVKAKYSTRSKEIIKEIEGYEQQKILKIVDEKYLHNLRLLKESLIKEKVIPFVGAGVSMPLGLPNWQGLIKICSDGLVGRDKKEFEELLDNNGDIFAAIDILINESMTYNETNIKEKISAYIKINFNTQVDNAFHNINDILNLNSDFYLTTNYDDALSIYQRNGIYPFLLDEIENLQDFFNEKQGRVVHLHGIYQRPKTMVVSKKDYEQMYSDDKTKMLLSNMLSYKLLFIGFSFEDKYFKDIFTYVKEYIGGSHFIILFDVYGRNAQALKESGLHVISLKLENEFGYDHVDLIKELFKYLLK
ncbi:SIR2 family protein [Ureibacillus chungkukjangi]|uniref:SIR2 family protein n=1 Tax=Ureibacillus chungkukjangi TaxID=1202712 RepID=UPI00384CDFDA